MTTTVTARVIVSHIPGSPTTVPAKKLKPAVNLSSLSIATAFFVSLVWQIRAFTSMNTKRPVGRLSHISNSQCTMMAWN